MNIQSHIHASVDHLERCEDAIMIFDGDGSGTPRAPVFAAIDGMGGQQHTAADGSLVTGREAAEMVRETLIQDLQRLPVDVDASRGGEAERKVIAAITRAHERVRLELNGDDDYPPAQRVGAVVTVVVVCENGARLLTVQVGDTRAYLLTEGEFIQLCLDEDNIEYFVRQGLLSPEDGERITLILNTYNGVDEPDTSGTVTIAGNSYDLYIAWRWFVVGNNVLNIPAANIVINALGIHAEKPIPLTGRIETTPGDTLLLCSDGLYKNLAEAEILAGLGEGDASADLLGEAALARSQTPSNRRSTQDDICAIVVGL